jgi:hypothetical protein
VLVDANGAPGALLPVAGVGLGAFPLDPIRVDSVAGPGGPRSPVRATTPMPDLDVFGAGLASGEGETVDILVDGDPVAHTFVDDAHLVLPAAPLAPGRHAVQARRRGPPLDPAVSGTATEVDSGAVDVLVVPTLGTLQVATGAGSAPGLSSGTVTVDVTPAVTPTQRVRLILDSRTLSPPVALVLDPVWPGGAPPFTTVDFAFDDAPSGQYRVTIEVDGARSLPGVDAAAHYVLTVVTL